MTWRVGLSKGPVGFVNPCSSIRRSLRPQRTKGQNVQDVSTSSPRRSRSRLMNRGSSGQRIRKAPADPARAQLDQLCSSFAS